MNIVEWRSGRTAIAIFFMALSLHAAPGVCGVSAAYDGYKILKVDIKDPIGFIALLGSEESLKSKLLLKANGPFSFDKFNQDNTALNATLASGFAASSQKLKLSFAKGDILDCDPTARTLRVQYTVFTTAPTAPSFKEAPSIEEKAGETDRPATTGAINGSAPGPVTTPLVGYDQARGFLGGLDFSDSIGKFHTSGEFEGSANSYTGYLQLGGNSGPFDKIWDRADWAGILDYEDAPAGVTRFEEAKIIGRFSASTKESLKRHVIVRYGAALEGGHQQSNKIDTATLATLAPNSEYGSLKLYAGVTGRPGNNAFTASYGFQLGSTFRNGVPDFKKHLVDLGFNTTLRRKSEKDTGTFQYPLGTTVHKALAIETRFTAGLIQDGSGAPLAERFLGGNAVRPFVPDDSWVIQSDAFIRSIPENQLGALSRGTALGGTRFYSANATLAYPLWGKPMLPKELAEKPSDPKEKGFLDYLNGQFNTATIGIANENQSKDPDYAKITTEAANLRTAVQALSDKIQQIPPDVIAQPSVATAAKALNSKLTSVRNEIALIAAGPNPQVTTILVNTDLPSLSTSIQALTASLNGASQAALASQLEPLMSVIEQSGGKIKQINDVLQSPARVNSYNSSAQQTLAPAHRALDVFLHELNIYSIAPVVIFDVARVWPVDEPVHYGVGGGLRLSLVNVNLTVAYGVNLFHVKPESAGAIFFKLDVTNLF